MLCLLETILGWINYGPYNMYAFLIGHITAQRTYCPFVLVQHHLCHKHWVPKKFVSFLFYLTPLQQSTFLKHNPKNSYYHLALEGRQK